MSLLARLVKQAAVGPRVPAAVSALVLVTAVSVVALRSPGVEDPAERLGSSLADPDRPSEHPGSVSALERSVRESVDDQSRAAGAAARTVGPSRKADGEKLGRGVYTNKVVIGWEGLGDSAGGTISSVGVDSPTATEDEQRKGVGVVVDHINSRGGIAGKRIEMVFHFVDVSSGTHDSRGAESCAFFTEDHEVFAVIALANHSHSFTRCLAARKTPLIDVSSTILPHDQKDLDDHAPFLYLPIRVNLTRLDAYIDALARQGFFKGDVRVGLLRYDWSTHERVKDQVIVPALARHGIRLTDEFAFSVVQSVGDLSRTGSEATNAVVRFRSQDINRLLFLPSAWVIPTVWPAVAESQGYRARYGINSWEGPDLLANNAPPEQLRGAIGIGWQPATDLGPARSVATLRANPHWGHCAAAGRKAGYPEEFATACTPFLFLQQAIAKSGSVTIDGLRSGADELGNTPYSNSNIGTHYGPGRYDGAATGRDLSFDGGCGCFSYRGGSYAIP